MWTKSSQTLGSMLFSGSLLRFSLSRIDASKNMNTLVSCCIAEIDSESDTDTVFTCAIKCYINKCDMTCQIAELVQNIPTSLWSDASLTAFFSPLSVFCFVLSKLYFYFIIEWKAHSTVTYSSGISNFFLQEHLGLETYLKRSSFFKIVIKKN